MNYFLFEIKKIKHFIMFFSCLCEQKTIVLDLKISNFSLNITKENEPLTVSQAFWSTPFTDIIKKKQTTTKKSIFLMMVLFFICGIPEFNIIRNKEKQKDTIYTLFFIIGTILSCYLSFRLIFLCYNLVFVCCCFVFIIIFLFLIVERILKEKLLCFSRFKLFFFLVYLVFFIYFLVQCKRSKIIIETKYIFIFGFILIESLLFPETKNLTVITEKLKSLRENV